jgi:hypothetical protein
MLADLGRTLPSQNADVIARAVTASALAALAVIHVVDLPGTLASAPLVGVGYLVIIAVAVGACAVMILSSHWLAWAAAGVLAAAAFGGYLLTRALPGGFLGDHADVGNWRCPLGLAALSVETLIIGLAAACGPWHRWSRPVRPSRTAAAPRRTTHTHPASLANLSPTLDSNSQAPAPPARPAAHKPHPGR